MLLMTVAYDIIFLLRLRMEVHKEEELAKQTKRGTVRCCIGCQCLLLVVIDVLYLLIILCHYF